MSSFKRCLVCLFFGKDVKLVSLCENGGDKARIFEKLFGIALIGTNQKALICEKCLFNVDLVQGFIEKTKQVDSTYFAAVRLLNSFGEENSPRLCRCCLSKSHLHGISRKGVDLLLHATGIDVREDQGKSWICMSCKATLDASELLEFVVNKNQKKHFNETSKEDTEEEAPPKQVVKRAASDVRAVVKPSEQIAKEVDLKQTAKPQSAAVKPKSVNGKIECPRCNRRFVLASSFQLHFHKIHESKKRFDCNFCDYATHRKDQFRHHITTHVDVAPLKKILVQEKELDAASLTCQFCWLELEDIASFRQHLMEVHQAKRGYECDLCGWRFHKKYGMTIHMINQHLVKPFLNEFDDESRPYICTSEGCSKRFTKQNTMNKHIRSVHSGIRLTCPHCLKSFSRADGLRKHQKYTCLSCPDAE